MANTTNFGWETPDDTDLVKDGALAMRTLGNAIDTSLVDLKGGTTGQILSKNSNNDLDYTWINNDQGDITEVQAGTGISVASGTGPIPVVTNTVATTFDAKGDLVAGTGADTFAKLTVGANNTVLTADSSTATGLKWSTPAGGLTLISRVDFSNVATQDFDNVFTSTYKSYLIVIERIYAATFSDDGHFQFRLSGGTTKTSGYYQKGFKYSTSLAGMASGGGNEGAFTDTIGTDTDPTVGNLWVSNVGQNVSQTSGTRILTSSSYDEMLYDAFCYASGNITGFRLKSSSTNITGRVAVYGLAV